MKERRQKVEELMEGFMAIKHRAARVARGTMPCLNITPAQWAVVLYLRRGTCTTKSIASALSITGSAATQLINGLVESGYVTRTSSPKDRRVVLVALSKKAHAHMETMKRSAVREFLELFKALTDREFEQYCKLNKKIVATFAEL